MARKKATAVNDEPEGVEGEPKKARSTLPGLGWTTYEVKWTGLTKLCSSVPANKDLVKIWLESRKPKVKPPGGLSIDETAEEVVAHYERQQEAEKEETDEQNASMLVFQHENGQCVMRAATVRAHLKDCARRISSLVGSIEGERAFSTKVISYVYPDERQYWIPILRPEGDKVTKPDGHMDRPVTSRFGTALKRFEFIEPWRLDFKLRVLSTAGRPAVSIEDLSKLFMYAGVHGYAGERGNGEGKYIAEVNLADEE